MISRRKFIGATAIAAGAFAVVPPVFKAEAASAKPEDRPDDKKPNSKFGGVQIGTITYSWRDLPTGATDIIKYCQEAGVSSLELMGDVAENFAGLPPGPDDLPNPLPPAAQARLDAVTKQYKMTVDQFKKMLDAGTWKMFVAGIVGATPEQVQWRTTVSMAKFEELRKMFDDAGIEIHVVKFSPATWSDGEIDYAFKAAKVLGAKGVSEEAGIDAAKKLGPFAEKHGMYAVFHNHFQYADKTFSPDPILAASPANMLNLDCGHYFGSTGLNPADFIKQYHARIFHFHLKDKTGPKTDPPNANEVWGQGEAPLADVLLLLKEHAHEKDWPKYADVELEYPVAKWSNPVKEVKTCVAYARQILI